MTDSINIGTPLYMSPEALTHNCYSPKSDIFAIGIILYEILTAKTPWECESERELIFKMSKQKIELPKFKNEKLSQFIEKACHTN
jgi:serine/threonine protein kinase